MDENDREFLKQLADALDRPRTRSTSAFVKSMASGGEGTPSEASELLYGLIGLASELESRIFQLEEKDS